MEVTLNGTKVNINCPQIRFPVNQRQPPFCAVREQFLFTSIAKRALKKSPYSHTKNVLTFQNTLLLYLTIQFERIEVGKEALLKLTVFFQSFFFRDRTFSWAWDKVEIVFCYCPTPVNEKLNIHQCKYFCNTVTAGKSDPLITSTQPPPDPCPSPELFC